MLVCHSASVLAVVFSLIAFNSNSDSIDSKDSNPSRTESVITLHGTWRNSEGLHTGKWEFQTNEDRPGVRVVASVNERTKEFELLNDSEFGPTVDMTARAHPLRTEIMLVLAVAYLSPDSNSISYRMIIHRTWKYEPTENHWWKTEDLMTRGVSDPYDGMSISFPGGDSVVLGLHDLTRRGGGREDVIESHYFVNHCPMGTADGSIPETGTEYYQGIIQGGGESMDVVRARRRTEAAKNEGE